MPKAIDKVFQVDEEGRLPKGASAFLNAQMQLYAGGDVRIQISRPTRSKRANRYLWGAVYKQAREGLRAAGITSFSMLHPDTGEVVEIPITATLMHEYFKAKYLDGLEPTSRTLDETAFSDFIEAIKQDEMLLRAGVYIEDPHEYA